MPLILTSNSQAARNATLDAQVQHLVARGAVSLQKAHLHLCDPARYPIDGAAASIERTARDAALALPPERLTLLRQRAMVTARESTAARALGVDPERITPVEGQSAFLPPGVTNARRWAIDATEDWPDRPDPPEPPLHRLDLRGRSLLCVRETGEWGRDEIDLGGSALVLEPTAGGEPRVVYSKNSGPFRVGSFQTGQRIDLGLRQLLAFPTDIGAWPKAFVAAFLLVEKDHGSFGALRDALDRLNESVGKDAVRALNGQMSAWEEIKFILRAVVLAIPLLFRQLLVWLGDDLFDPMGASLYLPSLDAGLSNNAASTPPETLLFTQGNARYELTYDWYLIR